jgi:hypothetical protein
MPREGLTDLAVVDTDPTALFLVYDTIMGVASAVSACRCACTGTLTHFPFLMQPPASFPPGLVTMGLWCSLRGVFHTP